MGNSLIRGRDVFGSASDSDAGRPRSCRHRAAGTAGHVAVTGPRGHQGRGDRLRISFVLPMLAPGTVADVVCPLLGERERLDVSSQHVAGINLVVGESTLLEENRKDLVGSGRDSPWRKCELYKPRIVEAEAR
jgi:hypothetical protein